MPFRKAIFLTLRLPFLSLLCLESLSSPSSARKGVSRDVFYGLWQGGW